MLLMLFLYIVHFFFLLIISLYIFMFSTFQDSLESCLMTFPTILHSLSYQALVILCSFSHNTLIENLLVEVEKVIVKLWYRSSILSIFNRRYNSLFKCFIKWFAIFLSRTKLFFLLEFSSMDYYAWRNIKLGLKVYDLRQAYCHLTCQKLLFVCISRYQAPPNRWNYYQYHGYKSSTWILATSLECNQLLDPWIYRAQLDQILTYFSQVLKDYCISPS